MNTPVVISPSRYLDYEIKQAGRKCGGHQAHDQWMKTQKDANAGASTSGLNHMFQTFLAGRGYNSTDTTTMDFFRRLKDQEEQ